MKTYTASELAEIIEKHGKWLNGVDGGERANLRSANLRSADLRSADMRSADLSYADLSYADLSYASLSYADLSYASLSYADLSSANLSSANLRSANLRSANLRSANLRHLVGNLEEIKSIQCDLWMVTYTSDILNIGCQSHKISEWWDFSDYEIAKMDSSALAWWRVWKPILQEIIKVSPAKEIIIESKEETK